MMPGRRLTASSKVIPGDLLFVDDAGEHSLWDVPVLDASADEFITSITFRSALFVVLAVSKVSSLTNIVPEQFSEEPRGMHAYLEGVFNFGKTGEFITDNNDMVTLGVITIDNAHCFRPGDAVTILWGWEMLGTDCDSHWTIFQKIRVT